MDFTKIIQRFKVKKAQGIRVYPCTLMRAFTDKVILFID